MQHSDAEVGRRGGFAKRMQAALAHRRLPIAVALLAVALTLPALRVGWVVDDYFHRTAMLGSRVFGEFVQSPMDMFRFLDGDPARTGRLMDLGFLPWWTYPQLKAAFWRPLTVLTHWLDYQLWPRSPALMHAHSLLWFGVLIATVALLYRRLMAPVWLAGLAALLYAIDDAHGMPVGFLANRNVLLSALFGVLALLAHDCWRCDGWRAGAVLGPLLLALSLLSKEAGVAICAYLAAYALLLDRGTWRGRFLALVPYVVVVLVWRMVWTQLGHGVAHLGLYVDPIAEPERFVTAVIERAPLLLMGQWAFPPAEIGLMLRPEKLKLVWRAAVLFLALLALVLLPLLRRDRLARFWGLGMLLAVVPFCSTFPADRLLFFVGIGATGLLAQFLAGVFDRATWRPRSKLWRVCAFPLACLFVLLHIIVAPLALPWRAAYPAGPKIVEQFSLHTPPDASIEQQDVVVVNAPSMLHLAYYQVECELNGQPVPRHLRVLASGLQPVLVHRPDARTLVIQPQRGYLAWAFERLFRSEQNPMALGQRVELTGMSVEVTRLTEDDRPAETVFRFDVPLEDASLRWLQWQPGGFVPFTPPEIDGIALLRPGRLSLSGGIEEDPAARLGSEHDAGL